MQISLFVVGTRSRCSGCCSPMQRHDDDGTHARTVLYGVRDACHITRPSEYDSLPALFFSNKINHATHDLSHASIPATVLAHAYPGPRCPIFGVMLAITNLGSWMA